MKKSKTKKPGFMVIIMIVAAVVLTGNLVAASLFPGYIDKITNGPVEKLLSATSRFTTIDNDNLAMNPPSGQGGVNLRRIEEDIDDQLGSDDPPAQSAEPQQPAQQKASGKGPQFTQEQINTALSIFQDSLRDRDVIMMGQMDTEKPYLSKSVRDNPFDEVQQVDIRPILDTSAIPPPPIWPPEGEQLIDETQWNDYIKTVQLTGVVEIEGKMFAYIKSGNRSFVKQEGDEFKDKFNVTVEKISFEFVLLTDETGKNKGLIDHSFRSGFQVQPIDGVTYITNFGMN